MGLEVADGPIYPRVMASKRTYDRERHAHFVTFSCYRRRRLLDNDRMKRVVLGVLNTQLTLQDGRRVGFVVMPEHVHAVVWFPGHDQIVHLMKQWKQRPSVPIKRLMTLVFVKYAGRIDPGEPVWQAEYYDLNLFTEEKTEEKLVYMRQNPVRAGLVERPCDWPWSSARFYESGRTVGVPVGWLD